MAEQVVFTEGAAHVLNRTALTLRRWRKENKGPPFRKVGGRYEYRLDLLVAFLNGDNSIIGLQQDGFPPYKPEARLRASEEIEPHVVAATTEQWKKRELFRRAQVLLKDFAGETERFEKEVDNLNWEVEDFHAIAVGEHNRTERAEFFKKQDRADKMLSDKAVEIAAQAGLQIRPSDPAFHVLIHLVMGAWKDILRDEARWRKFDYRGMPTEKPS